MRRDHGAFPRALWLDGALGAAGAATALAAVLSPVLSSAPQGELGAVLVGAAYTAADLLLVAMICGVLAGARRARRVDVAVAGRRARHLLARPTSSMPCA